jgi:hypothetical protein
MLAVNAWRQPGGCNAVALHAAGKVHHQHHVDASLDADALVVKVTDAMRLA